MTEPLPLSGATESRRPSRILIVDDNPDDAPFLREAIRSLGWNAEIEALPYGTAAIEEIRRRYDRGVPPDIILVDYRLAWDTGIQFLYRLRGSGLDPMPPVIIYTAIELSEALRLECYNLGVMKIFDKPESSEAAIKSMKLIRNLLVERGDISRGGSWISGDQR